MLATIHAGLVVVPYFNGKAWTWLALATGETHPLIVPYVAESPTTPKKLAQACAANHPGNPPQGLLATAILQHSAWLSEGGPGRRVLLDRDSGMMEMTLDPILPDSDGRLCGEALDYAVAAALPNLGAIAWHLAVRERGDSGWRYASTLPPMMDLPLNDEDAVMEWLHSYVAPRAVEYRVLYSVGWTEFSRRSSLAG